jgi:uncharacterized protein YjbI with pentapeptide repeats
MGSLLLGDGLRGSVGSEERTLARARTLTVLGRLDPSRKKALIQFLVDPKLVQKVPALDLGRFAPLIRLDGANLSDVDLSEAYLTGAALIEADLSEANLTGAYLNQACQLNDANLSDADLSEANLDDAILVGANLSEANLSGVKGITDEELEQQAFSLEGATMPNGQKYEDWLKDKEG